MADWPHRAHVLVMAVSVFEMKLPRVPSLANAFDFTHGGVKG